MVLKVVSRGVVFVYLALAIAAVLLAVLRLNESVEMPGLQAIELVLLALPWSLALGIEPFSHADLGGMTIIVVVGVLLNSLIVRSIARRFAHRIRLSR